MLSCCMTVLLQSLWVQGTVRRTLRWAKLSLLQRLCTTGCIRSGSRLHLPLLRCRAIGFFISADQVLEDVIAIDVIRHHDKSYASIIRRQTVIDADTRSRPAKRILLPEQKTVRVGVECLGVTHTELVLESGTVLVEGVHLVAKISGVLDGSGQRDDMGLDTVFIDGWLTVGTMTTATAKKS